ncbi:MobA/MobL family protein [Desulfovibrio falkowii]|uniref:MobA/MobL family protein n=1 Tax=Desulfovibrio falkowii TaxID=3136602 RepID=UPI0038B3F05A
MLQGNIHLNIKPVQRNKGQSIVARVAYQTASSIRDPRTGEWHNYRYKKSELGQTHLLLPKAETVNIPEYQQFWANLEAHYKRGNSVPARTASLALPVELSPDKNHELMLQYGHWLSDTYGVAVQVTSHKPYSSNPHFHLAITACTVMPDGSFGKKAIALDPISAQRELKQRIAPVEILRAQWANMVNTALETAGAPERVDHRSYLRRGIQEIPQKHEGVWRHSSQDRILGCPKEYNKNIETVNEVLHHDRRKFQETANPHSSFGKIATRGMGGDQEGTNRDHAKNAPDAHNYGQPAQGSKDAHGNHGRDSLGYGGRDRSAFPGEAQPENSGRCHHESEQPADFYELAHDSTGNVDSIGGKGVSDLIIPKLLAAVSALELETLRLSYSILRHESRRGKVSLKLPTSGLVDVVVQGITPLMATLETEALRLQNKSSDLWLRTCPNIVLPSANLTDIVSAPLSRLTHTLAPVSAELAFRIENLCKYIQEEAEKRHGAARVRGYLESATMPISANNEAWHKKLWELIVAKAVQEPVPLSILSRLHNAHIKVQSMFPQVTVSEFSRTLKVFSARTPEEQSIIIRDLAQRCPAQHPVSDLIIPKLLTAISALEMETLRLSYSILRHESRRAKGQLKLPTIGLVDVVAQGIMPLMATLETEALRLQNKSSDLWLRACPKIVLPSANITDIVSAPLSILTHTLAPVPAEMAFRVENLHKYRQEEAGKRHGAAHVHELLESATMPISASNETWHKKLWEILVAKAEQEPSSLGRLSRLHNAHIKVQLMFPQVTVADFSRTLKTFSARTPEEQDIIIKDLAQRCPAQRPVRIEISPLSHEPAVARYSKIQHDTPRAAQTPPQTPVSSLQKKPALQSPTTDPIQAMRKLWNEIQTYAEKDGKICLNTVDGKIKLQKSIEHIWRNNPEIPFEFMRKTIFRRVVSGWDNFERFLQQIYPSIAILKTLHDASDIQQATVLPHALHPQSSQGSEDNDGNDSGNSMSFT